MPITIPVTSESDEGDRDAEHHEHVAQPFAARRHRGTGFGSFRLRTSMPSARQLITRPSQNGGRRSPDRPSPTMSST